MRAPLLLALLCACTPHQRIHTGGAAMTGGAASLLTGAVLLVQDGKPGCDLHPPQTQCPQVWDTADAGNIALWTGVGVVAVGAVLVLWDAL